MLVHILLMVLFILAQPLAPALGSSQFLPTAPVSALALGATAGAVGVFVSVCRRR
jgi:hypothetical protein